MVTGPELTIVVPVYRCAECIETLFARGNAKLMEAAISAQWIFVDDGSPDNAWDVLGALCGRVQNVTALRLGRNIGQHGAIRVGLAHASSPWTAVMDCDLEDPPEDLARLLEEARRGYDIVIAAVAQHHRSRPRRLGSRLYRWLLGMAAPAGQVLTTFSIISGRARSAYLASGRAGDAYLLVLLRSGLPTLIVRSRRDRRALGRSAYTPLKLATVAARNLVLFRPSALAGIAAGIWLAVGLTLSILLPAIGAILAFAGFTVSFAALGLARIVALSRSAARRRTTEISARCGTLGLGPEAGA